MRVPPPLFGYFLKKVIYHLSSIVLSFLHLLDSFTKLASSDSGVGLPRVLCCKSRGPSAAIYSMSQGIDGDFSSGRSLQDMDQHRRPGKLKLHMYFDMQSQG